MKDLIQEFIPHAPQMGLYVAPDIPPDKRQNALNDYAPEVEPAVVLALYDATLTGNAKDGAVFTADRVVFQNTGLEAPQTVRYRDLVGVEAKRRLLGGKKVLLDVNRGQATFELTMDFSGASEAAEYVERFLEEAMHQSTQAEMEERRSAEAASAETDIEAVRSALDALRQRGQLSDGDYRRLMQVLNG